MKIRDSKKFEIQYFQITDIWKRFCELHNELLELTFDEYERLLDNDIDGLNNTIQIKELKIKEIAGIESIRAATIKEIGANVNVENDINSVSDLLRIMFQTHHEKEHKYLEKFNNLLVDIIEKIQEQNKKNQIFINKALISLKDIRLEAMGTKSFQTYDKNGSSKVGTSSIEG